MEGRPLFRNQRLVARIAVGLFAVFMGVIALQGIQYDEFWGKYGAVIRRAERPVHYWLLFSFFTGLCTVASYYFFTWHRREVSKLFRER